MYSLDNLQTLLKNPEGVVGVLHHFGGKLNQEYYRRFDTHSGFSVMDEEWDNLFLLDGCRYDLFEQTNTLQGTLESRQSPASSSSGFIKNSFHAKTFHDTVYVTANPHAFQIEPETFHATINLLDDEWNEDLLTVTPQTMADALREAHDTYPEKRIFGHFMQPHYPFIGEQGQQIDQGGVARRDKQGNVVERANIGDIWVKLQFQLNSLTPEAVWEAYRENLELVLDIIPDLAAELSGQTVLTSDHGNLVGDWIGPIPCRGFGHPPNLYVDTLTRVPWFDMGGTSRTITSDPPVVHESLENKTARKRLVDLGYAQD